MFFFNSKKDEEIKQLKRLLSTMTEDRDTYKKWYHEEREQLEMLRKEKDDMWKDLRIQIYEDVLKIEKRFIFIPRSSM